MRVIGISVDIDKIKHFKIHTSKGGKRYYNLTVVCMDYENNMGQDVLVHEKQSKKERDERVKQKFCGGGKQLWETTENGNLNGNPINP